MTRILLTVGLLIVSNIFMTLAWYAHLYDKRFSMIGFTGLVAAILLSWSLAFFEYMFQVPANRIGSDMHGGSLNLFQLKIIQEVITLTVFTVIAIVVFKTGKLTTNHLLAFICLVFAVFFAFRK